MLLQYLSEQTSGKYKAFITEYGRFEFQSISFGIHVVRKYHHIRYYYLKTTQEYYDINKVIAHLHSGGIKLKMAKCDSSKIRCDI